jgi:hypothetical protein
MFQWRIASRRNWRKTDHIQPRCRNPDLVGPMVGCHRYQHRLRVGRKPGCGIPSLSSVGRVSINGREPMDLPLLVRRDQCQKKDKAELPDGEFAEF